MLPIFDYFLRLQAIFEEAVEMLLAHKAYKLLFEALVAEFNMQTDWVKHRRASEDALWRQAAFRVASRRFFANTSKFRRSERY